MLHDQLQDVFRQVFQDPGLEIADTTSARDISRWDSLTHVGLIVAVEKAFGVRFKVAELARLQCVGDLKELLGKYYGGREENRVGRLSRAVQTGQETRPT
jgi:acyl carrier protein